jgi:hypothetical protein
MFSLRPDNWVLSSALIIGVAARGSDCLEMATPEQAMQCCQHPRVANRMITAATSVRIVATPLSQLHAALGQLCI